MRFIFTLFSLLLITTLDAQKLTGIWRGYFTSSPMSSGLNLQEERYKYEIQIEQLSNNSINGVTYSYKSTVFYGKAELKGILSLPAKSLIVRETKLIDLKIADQSEPCLMTCYLDYTKMGKLEVLEGTFISVNVKDKRDCGSGKIYLEKVTTTDFDKEPFLVKKQPGSTKKDTAKRAPLNFPDNSSRSRGDNLAVKPTPVKPGNQQTQSANKKTGTTSSTGNKATAQTKPAAKPPASNPSGKNTAGNSTVARNNTKKDDKGKNTANAPAVIEKTPEQTVTARGETVETPKVVAPAPKQLPVPRVLVERENSLVRTINTSEENITIEFYDNGTIDNDTISVYHNNELVVSNARLVLLPITVKIKGMVPTSHHEIVVVAENLGDIPPNTALMVIKAGRERYEVTLASSETRNAKVVINYIPKN